MRILLDANGATHLFSANLIEYLFSLAMRNSGNDSWVHSIYQNKWQIGIKYSGFIDFDEALDTKEKVEKILRCFILSRQFIEKEPDPIPALNLNKVVEGYMDGEYHLPLDRQTALEGITQIIEELQKISDYLSK